MSNVKEINPALFSDLGGLVSFLTVKQNPVSIFSQKYNKMKI